jgi:hypothetical protein
VVTLILAGIGWLDLLRRAGIFGFGPRVPGALPLEQLAGEDGQPLLRLMLAWLPVGALAALVLGRRRALALALVSAVLLGAIGAVSDAASISGPLPEHLLPQLSRAGTVVAVALIVLGARLAWWRTAAAPRAPSAR